jgi:hypothetical protein
MSKYYNDSTNTNVIPIIRVGEVKSVADVTKSGRIKVKITGVDKNENDNSLIDCVPLLPKYLTILPKVGECVFVFQYEYNDSSPTASFNTKRFWVGPLITQPTKLSGEDYNSAQSILPDGYEKLKDPNIDTGVIGNDEDITLQGRYNTDIIQKDKEVWLRVGKSLEGKPNKFNDKNLGYVQLKYGGEKLKREVEETEIETFVEQPPNVIVTVTMNTITNNGTILSNNLPKDRYRENDINRTEVFITVTDYKTGNIKTQYENESGFTGSESRDNALSQSKTFIDTNKGNRWRIKSTAKDLIDVYGGENGVANSNTPKIKVKKKIKEVKFVKNKPKNTSVINLVANKLNLISHDGEHTFNLTDPKSLITDDEQEKINNEAHPIVYGDTLVEFLNLVKKFVATHVHPYHGLPPDPSTITTDVLRFDLNTILNKNINTN